MRVIVTTNFDRLMETALRDERIEPTVVAHPADIDGLAPLHTIPVLVVHIHGDYLHPTAMLNTVSELGQYSPSVDGLLDRIFSDYGLLIVGWSATFDPALRNAVARTSRRIYLPYWVEPGHPSQAAEDLRVTRGAIKITADADTAFGQLSDATTALHDRAARHPLTLPVAVATAQRELAGRTTAIGLHDTLNIEIEKLRTHPDLNLPNHQAMRHMAGIRN